MASVTVKGWGVKQHRESVADYVAASTQSYSDGVAEIALDQADNAACTLGRLIETLVDKGVLGRADLVCIVGPDAPTVISLRRNSGNEEI